MRFIMKTPAIIQCEKCHNAQKITPDMFDCETWNTEREMGTETEYRFYSDFDCDSCGANLKIAISMYEYPENTYNSGPDVTMQIGCTVTENPKFVHDQSYEID